MITCFYMHISLSQLCFSVGIKSNLVSKFVFTFYDDFTNLVILNHWLFYKMHLHVLIFSTVNVNSNFLLISGICELKNLIELDLSGNGLEGHLPMCLNNLTKLRVLELSDNQLNGNFPSALASLISLEYLSLLNNNFGGPFSFSPLANLSKLEIFRLSTENNTVEIEELL